MSWLNLAAGPSGAARQVYGIYHYPPQNTYRVWIDNNSTQGSEFGRNAFGNESTSWHRLQIQYDADTTTAEAFVDGVSVNTATVGLNDGSVSLFMKDSSSLGSGPTVIEFDNFSYSADLAIAGGTAFIDVTDDDTAGITVSAISGNTSESGGTATFSVVLNSEPTHDVTIAVSSNDATEGTVAPASLTFTASNWNTAQVVTVTGVDDDVADGDIAYSILTAAATSGDANYDGLNAADVSVTNLDNDAAGITVSAISNNTSETGTTATCRVVLNSEPTGDVTIAVSSSDTTEGTVSPASLTFTVSNWNTAQVVTVTGVDDDVADGDIAYSILTAAATSSDAGYDGVNAADVAVTNLDNDTAGITVSAISGDTSESGGTATFSVVLNSEPTHDVTIGISSNDLTEGTVSTSSLTFTSGDWNTAQQLTVTGVDDAVTDGNVVYSILTAAAFSTDPGYNGFNAADVAVMNLDDDVPTLTLTIAPASVSENGGTATGTITRNDADLSSDLIVTLSSNDTSEATVPATVTIPAGSASATFTITAVDDSVVDGTQTVTISGTAAGYVGNAVDLMVTDDDGIQNSPPVITFISGTTKSLPGEVITITAGFTDEDLADVHTVTIDWGDGTVTSGVVLESDGVGSVTGDHEYLNAGVYVVTVTVDDGQGGRDSATTTSLVTGVHLIDGTLFIIGTDGRDYVDIKINEKKDQLTVHAKMDQGGSHGGGIRIQRTFVASQVQRIVTLLCDGDDHYNGGSDGGSGGGDDRGRKSGAADVPISQIVFGGGGNDFIKGGRGNDLLFGGAGRDELYGGYGHDILVGGDGGDRLNGGHGDDLLIGGELDTDWEELLDLNALDSALSEWARGDLADTMGVLGDVVDDGDKDYLFGQQGVDTLIGGRGDRQKP